jgi:hypothetical protein
MKINLGEYVVRNADGTIDVEATCQKFEGDLLVHIAERETEEEQVATAVHGVFDTYKGARINMPALVSAAVTRLGVQPANYQVLADAVHAYVRSNAGTLFTIQKGKGGGVSRISDEPKPKA